MVVCTADTLVEQRQSIRTVISASKFIVLANRSETLLFFFFNSHKNIRFKGCFFRKISENYITESSGSEYCKT
jgi:hypothetical protein